MERGKKKVWGACSNSIKKNEKVQQKKRVQQWRQRERFECSTHSLLRNIWAELRGVSWSLLQSERAEEPGGG